jgi:hypothetical protein
MMEQGDAMIAKPFVWCRIVICVLAAATSVNSQSGAGNLYQDPQARFTVRLASGWTASALDQNTVQFAGDGAYATVFVLRGSGTAEEFISLLAGQYAQKWKDFKQLKSAQATLGGLPGVAAAYSGINPNGVLSSLRIVAASRAGSGYGLLIFSPQDRLRAAMPALDLLESSLAPPGVQAPSGVMGLGAMPQAQRRMNAPVIAGIPRGGLPLQPKQLGYCRALAPADWAIVNVSQNSNAVDLFNGAFAASWMVRGVTAAEMMYYPQQFGSPDAVLMTYAMIPDDPYPPQFSAPQPLGGGYAAREFETPTRHGVVIYTVYPQAMGGFIITSRTIYGPKQMWQAYGPVAVAVALTIRCTVQLQVSPWPGGGAASGASREESTYNQQLGTEYAHDPVTGENFLMDYGADHLDNGPQGPGFYRDVNGELRKLELGRTE